MKAYVVEREALIHNIQALKRFAGDVPIWGVLKGNGYGIGLIPLARHALIRSCHIGIAISRLISQAFMLASNSQEFYGSHETSLDPGTLSHVNMAPGMYDFIYRLRRRRRGGEKCGL